MILDYVGGPRYRFSKRRGMRWWGGGDQREIGDVAWKQRSERKGETWTCHYSFDKREGGVTSPGMETPEGVALRYLDFCLRDPFQTSDLQIYKRISVLFSGAKFVVICDSRHRE